jgi:diacylglycerol kinase (ATP)
VKRIRVLVNPSAGSGRAWARLRRAGLLAEREDARLEWIETRAPEHLVDLVHAAQADDLAALALAGGDGTVSLALASLEAQRVPLAILPVGSGNDFARDCGVPASLTAAFSALLAGARRRVDLGRCGARRFCCVAAAGLDELALRFIYGSRLHRSKALNIWCALRALVSYRPRPVRIAWQGGGFEGEVMFAAITNTRSYGGGFLVCPDAQLDDGKLDVCIVERTGRARLLSHFPRILDGTHAVLPEVTLAQSPWVRLESLDGALPIPLDAELGAAVTPIELVCAPRALDVIVAAR